MKNYLNFTGSTILPVLATISEADELQVLFESFARCFDAFSFELIDKQPLTPIENPTEVDYSRFHYEIKITSVSLTELQRTEDAFRLMADSFAPLRNEYLKLLVSVEEIEGF